MAEGASIAIRAARSDELPAMLTLLHDGSLPVDGVPQHLPDFLVADQEGTLVGMVGLERYGQAALLRSLVVRAEARGAGLGARLVHEIAASAQRGGATELVLLTTTAADWFPRLGFVPTTREAVPAAVTASVEFQGACPASATVMRAKLPVV